jgi:GntR family transcriptional regulator
VKKSRSALKIDPASSVALHEQVAAAIRRAVADGEARPGERLPPARDLATVLGVNPNTVLRALRTLRDEGLLEFRRGRGVTVSEDASRKNELILKGNEFVEVGRRLGYRPDELIQIIRTLAPASR